MAQTILLREKSGDDEWVIESTSFADAEDILDDSGNEVLEFNVVSSAVNHIELGNAATGNNPTIACNGEDDTGITFQNNQQEEMLILDSVATSVNELTIRSAATGNKPILAATGEADNGLEFHNDQAEEMLILNSVATSVNEFTVSSAAAGSGPQLAATGDDTDINVEVIPKGVGYVDIQNGGLQVVAQSVTPNNDSGTASTIEDGAIHVDVGAVTTDANDWIVLPSLANVPVGHTIVIACNAGTNFEMRTPSTSGEKINTVDCDGSQEYLCTDTEVIYVTKVSDTDGWVASARTALGAVATAVIPD